MVNILAKPTQEIQNKLTLWLNHLLVLYMFLLPINNNAKSSVFFVILVLFLYRRNYWNYLKDIFSNRIIQVILLFYIIHALGMLYTDNIDYGKDQMDRLKYLLFPLVFLSFLDTRFVFRIIIAFLLGMFISILFSYLIHYEILPYTYSLGKYEIWETFPYSPTPFLSHGEHSVGISLFIGFLLYYVLNFKEDEKYKKALAIVLIVIALVNISFIASRTGYMTLVGVIVITVFVSYKTNIKILLAALSSIVVVLFSLYSISNTINERVDIAISNFQKGLSGKNYYENGSTAQRIGLTIYSFEVIKENPVFGVGTGDHMDLLREKIPDEEKRLREIAKPHNLYVQIPMQTGVIGLLTFFFLLYTIIKYNNISKEKKDLSIIMISTILIFMLGGMLYGTFELPLMIVLLSAMIVYKQYDFTVDKINSRLFVKYLFFTVLFLIIGITK